MKGKGLTKKNLIAAALLQVVNVIHGFVMPKIIISFFGSEVNGMVSSIIQFLNYIQLLEGGLGAVVMASLYKPLAGGDTDRVSAIIKATEQFFRRVAVIYAVYTVAVALVYPLIVDTAYSYGYICSLVLIIAIGTFIQYFFALPYRLLINADKHGYVVSLTNVLFLGVGTVLVLLAAWLLPSIHIIRLAASAAYVVSPVVFWIYVRRHYRLDPNVQPDQAALAQRWDAFGQNLAYFIRNNTDMVLLTLFASLADVSVYSVYSLIVVALRSLLKSLSDAVAPTIGRERVTASPERLNLVFDRFELGLNAASTVVFSCCAVLIVPFVKVFTAGVSDANYDQPLFAMLLTFSAWVYCCRDSFGSVIYIAGHIRQTSRDAYIEAGVNLVLSLILVRRFGLLGVGVGVSVAMVYRMLAMVVYVKKHILHRPARKWLKGFAVFGCGGAVSVALASAVPVQVTGYGSWLLYAVITGILACAVNGVCVAAFYGRLLRSK